MSFDKKIVTEINELREDPKKYSEKIAKYITYFEGKTLKIPGRKSGITTHEGARAYEEAVNYLSRKSPVEPLQPSKGLFRSAQDFLQRIQRKNADVDSIDVDKLMEKYGTYYGDFIRGTDYGGENVEESIINLIVSDGDRNRRQRESLLSTDYKLIGAATGTHPIFRHCTVIFTCTEFENTYDAEDIGFLDGSPAPKSSASSKPAAKPQSKYTDETTTKYNPDTGSTSITTVTYEPRNKLTQPKTTSKYAPLTRSTQQISTTNRYQTSPSRFTQQSTTSKYEPLTRSSQKLSTTNRFQPQTSTTSTTTTNRFEPLTKSFHQTSTTTNRFQPQTRTTQQTSTTTNRFQPQTRTTQQTTTSRYNPLSRSSVETSTTTSRYNPSSRTSVETTTTNNRYEPKGKFTQQTTTSKYNPLTRSSVETTTTTSKYNPLTRTSYETTTTTNVYEPKKSIRDKYQSRFQTQPLTSSVSQNTGNNKDVYVVSEKRKEKFTMEGGKRVKHITIEKVMSDGSRETETLISD